MTPFEDFAYLINHVLLEPTIEDFILLIGTVVAFIAFILWCCFPIHAKENIGLLCKSQHSFSDQTTNNYSQIMLVRNGHSNRNLKNEQYHFNCCT